MSEFTHNTKLTVPETNLIDINDSSLTSVERLTLDPRVDTDKLQAIIEMQYIEEDRRAKKEFIRDMVKCQTEMPAIKKDKQNNQTDSLYAKVETIKRAIKPVYTNHGFAITFREGEARNENDIRLIATVMHISGHSEEHYYDNPMDNAGIKGSLNKTPTHGKSSGISYAERYLLKLIFNLELHDEDDDGNQAGTSYITAEQVLEIETILKNDDRDREKFIKYLKVESLSLLPANKYNAAIVALKAKK